jgi:REP element-mobilizing transposase RayT/Fe-S-cluster containining protein
MPSNPKPIEPRGWHSRGYHPHFDGGKDFAQSVTFRLADSLPRHVAEQMDADLKSLPTSLQDPEKRKRIEAFLDAGYGSCSLREPPVSDMVESALLFFDGERYRLHAWVVMPNHVHVIFTPIEPHSLSQIVGSWKTFTAKEANRLLGRSGQYWQEDYFDRFIRDEKHFEDAVNYIEGNPVAAGLCARIEDWPRSSARRRASSDSSRASGHALLAAGTAADPGKTEPTVSATFKLSWQGRDLSATVALPAEPVSPRRLLPMVQGFTNALVGMGENLVESEGESVSCKAGCGACCRQLVPVSETEARHLSDLVEAMPEPRRAVVRERFTQAKRELAAAGLLSKLEKPNEHTRDTALGMDYFRAGVPCPFLEDESCSIHPDRPLVCREYLVTSPAEHCANPDTEHIRRVPKPGFAMSSFAKLDGPAKFGVRWVALPLALDWAEWHPEPPAAIPGPKLFEAFMNALLNGAKVPPPGDFTHRELENQS